MAAGKITQLVGFEVAGAGVYLPAPCGWPSGVLRRIW